MLPSWGVGKSIDTRHLNSTCRHIFWSSNTQTVYLKTVEHHMRLQFAAQDKTCNYS